MKESLPQALAMQRNVVHQLERSAWHIPSSAMQAEYGQVNSISNDTRFTISQSIAFPKVYRRQLDVYKAQTQSALLTERITQFQVKKQVMRLYYEMLILLERGSLLKKADSLLPPRWSDRRCDSVQVMPISWNELPSNRSGCRLAPNCSKWSQIFKSCRYNLFIY